MKSNKIYTHLSQLQSSLSGGTMVFTNGCFDLLHKGHYYYLGLSRNLGDYLVIGLNSDSSVRSLKGQGRPINTWEERSEALAKLDFVDLIVKFDELTPLKLIKELRPAVITKGGDYTMEKMIGKKFVESYNGSVVILPYLKGHSTSKMLGE